MKTLQYGEAAVPALRSALVRAVLLTLALLLFALAWRSGTVQSEQAIPALMLITAAAFVTVGAAGNYDLLNPVRIFGFIWCACAGLAALRLLPLLSEWSPTMWNIVIVGPIGFVIGYFLFWRQQQGASSKTAENLPAKEILPFKPVMIVAGICLVIGILALANGYIQMREIPIFSENPDLARMRLNGVAGQRDPELDTWFNKIVFLFVLYCRYSVFLALLMLFTSAASTWKRKVVCILMIAAGSFAYGSQGGRSLVFDLAVVGLAMFHYLKRRIRLREAVVGALLLAMLVGMAGYYRIKATGFAPALEKAMAESNIADNPMAGAVAVSYVSATISFEVLNRLTDDLQYTQQAHGHLFYFANKLVPRENLTELSFNLYSGEMITPTFLGEFYADYGLLGVFFGPFILGIAYACVYRRAMHYKSLYMMFVLAMMIQVLVYFPYVNLFSQYLTWIWDLLSMAILWRVVVWLDGKLQHGREEPLPGSSLA